MFCLLVSGVWVDPGDITPFVEGGLAVEGLEEGGIPL